MKKIWGRITLMKYASDEDNGHITADKVLGTVVVFLAICGAYLIAAAMVRG